MAGFLSKKKQLLDYKLTEHGRKQLSTGDLRFKYYTFSDRSIVYSQKIKKGKKFSDSEFNFLSFETTTSPGIYFNPEFYLTSEIKYENNNPLFFNANETYKTLSENIAKSEILTSLTLGNNSLRDVTDFRFDYLEIVDNFDFVNSIHTRRYPTIKYLKESISNLVEVKKDERFKDFIKFKKMAPLNLQGQEIIESQEEENNRQNSKINRLLKNFTLNSKVKSSDSLEVTVSKILKTMDSSSRIFKLKYSLDREFAKENDFFHFEMHKVVNNTLDKIPFVNLGSFYDNETKSLKSVFLIGKFLEDINREEKYNIENNTTFINSIKEYYFINMFILVVEQ